MIGFHHNRSTTAQAFANQRCYVSEIHQGGYLHAGMHGSEAKVVYCIMRDRKRMEIDLAHTKIFARLDLFHSILECSRTTARLFITDAKMLADIGFAGFCGNVDGAIE